MEVLTYCKRYNVERRVLEVKVFSNDRLFFQIECLDNSSYGTEEEIQNWLDANGYLEEEFEFEEIEYINL